MPANKNVGADQEGGAIVEVAPAGAASPAPPPTPAPERPVTIEEFGRNNARRLNRHGESVEALELMAAFVHTMHRANRQVDTPSAYRVSWEAYSGQ